MGGHEVLGDLLTRGEIGEGDVQLRVRGHHGADGHGLIDLGGDDGAGIEASVDVRMRSSSLARRRGDAEVGGTVAARRSWPRRVSSPALLEGDAGGVDEDELDVPKAGEDPREVVLAAGTGGAEDVGVGPELRGGPEPEVVEADERDLASGGEGCVGRELCDGGRLADARGAHEGGDARATPGEGRGAAEDVAHVGAQSRLGLGGVEVRGDALQPLLADLPGDEAGEETPAQAGVLSDPADGAPAAAVRAPPGLPMLRWGVSGAGRRSFWRRALWSARRALWRFAVWTAASVSSAALRPGAGFLRPAGRGCWVEGAAWAVTSMNEPPSSPMARPGMRRVPTTTASAPRSRRTRARASFISLA